MNMASQNSESAGVFGSPLKGAAERLNAALARLDGALDPVLARLSRLETTAKEAEVFGEDRARLASDLDASATREAELRAKVEEYSKLSEDTRTELDNTIAVLRDVLGEG